MWGKQNIIPPPSCQRPPCPYGAFLPPPWARADARPDPAPRDILPRRPTPTGNRD
ncbi:hypothetical protein ANT2_1777 [plant metagenome]|uniref:Uncharacterized protein n=1 Tax=plant metagenome TaxID=1297885 RepID=A0A484REL3_9ZZZZ